MGTNYYVVKNKPSVSSPIHIGRASCGWLFHFQSQNDTWNDPPVVWNTYSQIKDWLYKYTVEGNDFVIMDEYDRIVPYEDFIEIVEWHQKDEKCRSNKDNFSYDVRNVDGYRFSDGDFW